MIACNHLPVIDGKDRFLDNNFVERLWRSLTYECVCLHAWETGSEAKGRGQKMDGVLQSQAPTFRSWRQAASRGLLAKDRNTPLTVM